jgi:hypothetical protein
MVADNTYVARALQLAGLWETALDVLGEPADTEAAELRAELLLDLWFWRTDGLEAAEKAIGALPESTAAHMLRARLAYSRLLFKTGERPDDYATAEAAFRIAVEDASQRGWAEFHWGVLLDNIAEDAAAAVAHFETALEIARASGDHYLESYVIRHLASYRDETERVAMLRRSLHLRAAVGARPQTAAAQVALIGVLPEGDPERETLIEAARGAAEELRLAWVLEGLKGK